MLNYIFFDFETTQGMSKKIFWGEITQAAFVLTNDDFESFMAISHIVNPSVAQTINEIIDRNSNNKIQNRKIPPNFIGKTFSELFNYFYTKTVAVQKICEPGLYRRGLRENRAK